MKNFQEIIKEEWEKEFPFEGVKGSPENPEYYENVTNTEYENSLFISVYDELVQRICTRVYNQALEDAANNADADYTITEDFNKLTGEDIEAFVIKESILKLKL